MNLTTYYIIKQGNYNSGPREVLHKGAQHRRRYGPAEPIMHVFIEARLY